MYYKSEVCRLHFFFERILYMLIKRVALRLYFLGSLCFLNLITCKTHTIINTNN